MRADHLLLTELPKYRRGRAEGEVKARLAASVIALGQPAGSIEHVPDELAAVVALLGEVGAVEG